tara:strand:- start:14018 stop:14947 length:930 start_codon:yes stop_codon:yes gene_type:complete
VKTILVSGCCGFIGQNLVSKLLKDYNIIGIDNFSSSSRANLKKLQEFENFKFIEANIINPFIIKDKVDYIFNLACPASPPKYQSDPIFTLETNFIGTHNLLKIAKENKSIFIQASTSEIYGDPKIHPQVESYRGNVNTIGKRSCYDEGKRIAETLCYEYREKYNLKTRIVRIFNTYGPGMDPMDGRVISNFIVNTLKNKPLIIYGDGNQTRSFCYVDDMVDALIRCMKTDFAFPINLGNDNEISLNELAKNFIKKFGANSVEYSKPHDDDPQIRQPNIERANSVLKWSPSTLLQEGLDNTYEYFKSIII